MAETERALTHRPAALEDSAFAADLATAQRPDEPEDPASWRHWWQSADPAWTVERFIALRGGTAVGYLSHVHAPWEQLPRRYGRIRAEFAPAERSDARLAAGFDFIEQRSRATGTAIYST